MITKLLSLYHLRQRSILNYFINRYLLNQKTRLLVTNSIYFLKNCDEIVLFDNGYIKAIENYRDLIENSKQFRFLVQNEAEPDMPNSSSKI